MICQLLCSKGSEHPLHPSRSEGSVTVLQAGGHRELCTTEGGHTRPLSLMGSRSSTTRRKRSYQAVNWVQTLQSCAQKVSLLPRNSRDTSPEAIWLAPPICLDLYIRYHTECAISVHITLMASVYTVYAYRKLKLYYFRRIWTVHHPFWHRPHTKHVNIPREGMRSQPHLLPHTRVPNTFNCDTEWIKKGQSIVQVWVCPNCHCTKVTPKYTHVWECPKGHYTLATSDQRVCCVCRVQTGA